MFEGVQFPKTFLVWIEAHPGTAGWVQAVGAISIILATWHLAGADTLSTLGALNTVFGDGAGFALPRTKR
jgi:hypothetical protein